MMKSTLLKGALQLCLLTATIFGATSCSDDDPGPRVTPTLPCTSSVPVRSVTHDGTVTAGYDWQLTYADGRLVEGLGTVRDPQASIDKSYTYRSTIEYGFNNTLGLKNSSGDNVVVKLNSYGLIERMTVDRNTYEFAYIDNRLSSWRITLFENSFGHSQQFRSTGELSYENGDLKKIIYTGPDNSPVELVFESTALPNINGLLPETVSKEMGLMGYEHLYYAGLFGRATAHLPASVTRKHSSDSTLDYKVDFEYSHVGGNTKLCTYRNGTQPTIASYTY